MTKPVRILTIDVGTGTQDILLFQSGRTIENCFRLIMPSPTIIFARRIQAATRRGDRLVLTGVTMGGGPCHWAARDHVLAGYPAFATPDAARTFDDDLSKVEEMGIQIVDEAEAKRLTQLPGTTALTLGDFDGAAIRQALQAFDIAPDVDGMAIAAFDHGAAPPHVSDRLFRFSFIAQAVQQQPHPSAFAYRAEELPPALTRLAAIARSARAFTATAPILLMDTGAAAALGTLDDPLVAHTHEVVLANIGNFHTLAFHLVDGQIRALFEHHTGLLDRTKLEALLERLVAGSLTNEEVFDDNGHGALRLSADGQPEPRRPFPLLAVTGPRRELLRGSRHRPYEAVPHGDMMLTGNFGLLRAFAQRYPAYAEAITDVLDGRISSAPW
jgi:uncharacterized protein (DUF1786 family)